MAGPVYRAARRAYRFADGRLARWISPERAAVARMAMLWTGHLFFPGRIGQPASEHRLSLQRLRTDVRPLPDWALQHMRAQAEFEPLLFPSVHRLSSYYPERLPVEFEGPGLAFARLHAMAGREPIDQVIAVPWLKVGGADRAALLHAEAMVQAGQRVLVLATEVGDSPWASKLPPGARFVPAGGELAALDKESRRHVLARLLLQWRPHTLHIIHSPEAWETVRAFGRAIANSTRIYASAFCDDITPEGERVSAARSHARDCAPVLSGLLTDCQYYADVLKRDTGIAPERIHVVYLPVDPPKGPLWERPSGPLTVLWAGRLDRQKRPDILAAIAEQLPDVRFEVFGAQVLDTARDTVDRLTALSNVRLHGSYQGFDSLPWRECHVFLYTSQWDGLPTVLLEAAARGLPVVAPAVGGITELPRKSDIELVKDFDNVSAYSQALLARVASRTTGTTGEYLSGEGTSAESWQSFSAFSNDVRAMLA
jgi:glycosyltransferase involved in cell wall biosynthesis